MTSATILRMRRGISRGLGAAAILVTAACGAGTPPNALAGKTPQQVLSVAIATAERFGSVHYILQTGGSSQQQTVIGDAGARQGAQTVVMGADKVEVLLIGTGAYLRGNAGGLKDVIGLPSATATQYAGKWISVQPSDSLYQGIARAVTLPDLLDEVKPSGRLASGGPETLGGHAVVGVRGGLSGATGGTTTFWVTTAPPAVPIGVDAQTTSAGGTASEVGAFSKWGERLRLTPPAGSVPYSGLSLPAK